MIRAPVCWVWLSLVLVLAGCPEVSVTPLGRPCAADDECGPEGRCDRATGTCVAGSASDTSGPDQGPGPDAAPDGPPPDAATDAPPPDAATDAPTPDLPPDLALPDVTPDLSQPDLPPDLGPQPDLGCAATCSGCCQGNVCIPTASQSVPVCGQGGEACKSCDDGNPCTADGCIAGACQNLAVPTGTGCDDNNDCTYLDQCQGTTCQGTPATCTDGLTCTTDSCTGNPPPNECTFQLDPGYCLVGTTCLQDNASYDSCSECQTSISIGSWAPAVGCVSTFAGQDTEDFRNGPQLEAWFDDPCGVAVDAAGVVYVADRDNQVIRKIADGVVTTLAGVQGQLGFADGPAATALFNLPYAVAVGPAGKVYVADTDNNRIRVIDNGVVTTIAGLAASGDADGPALTVAQFDDPIGLTVDAAGVVYVADRDNHKIRTVSGGTVTTLAGTGLPGYVDGGVAQAQFELPHGVALDAAGAVYVTDRGNNRIRKIDGGSVTTIAGSGPLTGGFQDGPVSTARLGGPLGIVVDASGKVYFTDNDNERIRMVAAGSVTTVAGTGVIGYQDGPALTARFDDPYHLALHAGLIYIADSDNGLTRLYHPPP